MTSKTGLVFGEISSQTKHICVDMQRIFSEDTPWRVEWFSKILPFIEELVKFSPENTIFTRFIPIDTPLKATGAWKRYYSHWQDMTLSQIEPALTDIVPELNQYIPPAITMNKYVYSPWVSGHLHQFLQKEQTNTLIISGGETDICVLSTILGAVDLGYRVILAKNALCSSHDDTHDSILELLYSRFSYQIEIAETSEILKEWHLE